jgi:hypothetical protein
MGSAQEPPSATGHEDGDDARTTAGVERTAFGSNWTKQSIIICPLVQFAGLALVRRCAASVPFYVFGRCGATRPRMAEEHFLSLID